MSREARVVLVEVSRDGLMNMVRTRVTIRRDRANRSGGEEIAKV